MKYADSSASSAIQSAVTTATGNPIAVDAATGRACAITLTASDKATPSALLKTYDSARLYSKDGTLLDEGHAFIAAAVAATHTGGKLVLFGSGTFTDEILMETDGYANKDIILSLAQETEGIVSPIGCGTVIINAEPLEHLTRGESVVYFLLLTVLLPASVLAVGTVIWVRRRNR